MESSSKACRKLKEFVTESRATEDARKNAKRFEEQVGWILSKLRETTQNNDTYALFRYPLRDDVKEFLRTIDVHFDDERKDGSTMIILDWVVKE